MNNYVRALAGFYRSLFDTWMVTEDATGVGILFSATADWCTLLLD